MKAYQLKITIKNSKPPIWRRCIVPAGLSFSQLTVVLHKVMGWWEGHLSEYTFGNQGVKLIEDADENDYGYWDYDMLDSSEYLIDEFFEDTKSFSYLYDFGDNWNHQVQIEKVLDDYEFDYPMVTKFKADTPPEDCGGIWGYYDMLETLKNPEDPEYEDIKEWFEDQFMGPYDMEQVNSELQKYKKTTKKIKPIKEADLLYNMFGAKKAKYALDQVKVPKNRDFIITEENQKEATNALKSIGDKINELIKARESADRNLRNTYGDSNVDNYYEYLQQTNNGEKKVKIEFDYDNWKEVTIETSKHQMQDLMLNLRDIDVKNYMKYLQLPDIAGARKLERIRKILSYLKDNPKYYLYLISEDTLEVLFDLFDGDTSVVGVGEYVSGEVADALAIGIMLAFLEVKEKGSKVQIRFAEDAGEILEAVRVVYKKSAKKIYKELDEFDRQLGVIIRAYGVVDINRIPSMINDLYGSKADETELARKIYLHCAMNGALDTATDYLSGGAYVVELGVKAQEIMEYRSKSLSVDFDYKRITKDDPLVKSVDMTDIYYSWSDMGRLLEHDFELDWPDLGFYMDDLFRKTVNGCDAVTLFEVLREIYPSDNPFVLSQYWQISSACVLETGIPHLMGYSRYEYYKKTGQRPQGLTITSLSTTGKMSKGPKAHLMYLSEDALWELYEIQLTEGLEKNKDEYAERAEELLSKYPDNIELMAALAEVFLAVKRQDRAEFLLRRIKKLAPELSSDINRMQNIIKKGKLPDYFKSDLPFHDNDDFEVYDDGGFDFWDEDLPPVMTPVVRDHPKVGRNDPCPCGSGKKFKKCCMGKGIYD